MRSSTRPARAIEKRTVSRHPQRWQIAGSYEFICGVYELNLVDSPSQDRWAAEVATQQAEFALIEEGPVLLLAFRFGVDAEWNAAPHGSPIAASQGLNIPSIGGPWEERAMICVRVIDAQAQTLKVQRNWTLSLNFTRALNAAIRERHIAPPSFTLYSRTLDRLARQWPSISSLVGRSRLRSLGGI